MGFKIRNLGQPFRTFTANLTPQPYTAGVPIAETYLGGYGVRNKTAAAGHSLLEWLALIDEVTVTRSGQTIVSIENGNDLMALELAPWFDHDIDYVTGGSSAHTMYFKGLTLPCAYPPGHQGEFQISVDYAAVTGVTSTVLSIAEGQGYYAHNMFGYGEAAALGRRHFHIVKRLYTPTATGWNSGFDIGTEGELVGLLIWQTDEQDYNVTKTAINLYEIELQIGGETVIQTDCLTIPGRQGRPTGQANTNFQAHEIDKQNIFDQYVYLDFARQGWDCRGKSVRLMTNQGTDGTPHAIRAYPIYLVPW